MVKIKGKLNCKECGWEEEDSEMEFHCPSCMKSNITHTPPHKILLCEKDMHSGHGKSGGTLSNTTKKIRDNEYGKGDIFRDLLKMIRSENKEWTSSEIIKRFNVVGFTDGDVIRKMLDVLVCRGYLTKKFMKGNTYHLYENKLLVSPCEFLKFHEKGKREGIYYCNFDFKNKGKEVDSKKIFKK